MDNNLEQFLKKLDEEEIELKVEDGKLRYSAYRGPMTDEIMQELRENKEEMIDVIQQRSRSKLAPISAKDEMQKTAISALRFIAWVFLIAGIIAAIVIWSNLPSPDNIAFGVAVLLQGTGAWAFFLVISYIGENLKDLTSEVIGVLRKEEAGAEKSEKV